MKLKYNIGRVNLKINTKQVVALLITAIAIVICFSFVLTNGGESLNEDDWDLVSLNEKYADATLDLKDFLKFHNEHRYVIPKVFLFALTELTNFNMTILLVSSQIFLMLILFLIFYSVYPSFVNIKSLLLYIPLPFIFLSLRQWGNLLWGFQVGYYLNYLFSFLAIYFYTNSTFGSRLFFKLSILGAFLATFSHLEGQFTWIVIAFLILLNKEVPKMKWKRFFVWCILGAISIGLYWYGSDFNFESSSSIVNQSPIELTRFFLVLIGNGLSLTIQHSLYIGAVLLFLFLLLLFRKSETFLYYLGIGMSLLSLVTMASITIGRFSMGVERALISNYSFYSLSFISGILLLVINSFNTRKRNAKIGWWLSVGFSGMLLFLTLSTLKDSLINGKNMKMYLKEKDFVLKTFESQPDSIFEYYFSDNPEIKNKAMFLKRSCFNVFANVKEDEQYQKILSKKPLDKEPLCGIDDKIIRMIKAKDDDYYLFSGGWAVDSVSKKVARAIFISVEDKDYEAFYGIRREDVANYFQNASYLYSGFKRAIPASHFRKDTIVAYFKIINTSGTAYYETSYPITYVHGQTDTLN